MEIEPGRQYVFEIKGVTQFLGTNFRYGSVTLSYLVGSGLDLLEPAAGLAKVQACCKFKAPVGS